MANFKNRILSGVLFMAIAKYSGIIINLIVISILSRILHPEEFGTVSIVTIFIGFFSLVSDFGLASAIIQNKDLRKTDYDNIFSITAYFALILSTLYVCSLFPLSHLYGTSSLLKVGVVLVCQVFFVTINIVPNALLLKDENFRFISIRQFCIQIISGSCAVLSAYKGLGIYSLTVSPVLSSILIFLINYSQNKLSFSFKPNLSSLKKILSYSLFSFGYNIVNYFSRNLDKFVLGKSFSLTSLGYYEKSYSIMTMPIQNVISVLNPVMHPVLSSYQNNGKLLAEYLCKFAKILAIIGMPISVFVYFASDDIVHILLGNNWEPSIRVIQLFAPSIWIQLVYSLQGPFFLAIGDTRQMFKCGIVTTISMILAVTVGVISNDINMVAFLTTIAYYLSTVYTYVVLVKKSIGTPLGGLIEAFKPAFLCMLTTLLPFVLYCLLPFQMNMFLSITIKALITVVGFIAAIIFSRDKYIITFFKSLKKR